jgi:hypothetical protein
MRKRKRGPKPLFPRGAGLYQVFGV